MKGLSSSDGALWEDLFWEKSNDFQIRVLERGADQDQGVLWRTRAA